MRKEIEQRLTSTYELIRQSIPSAKIDSLEVVKQVEEYRQYWRPEKVNVVLLAESHVYTEDEDYEAELDEFGLRSLPKYPLRFVRFVYCLGYGENGLLNRRVKKNAGTWQYWEIFSSCVAENEYDLGFNKVLKTETRSFITRIYNKIGVLQKLKKKGVWLLDASIVGLYGSGEKDSRVTEKVLGICWKNYIKDMILEANPRHIIVIGKGVEAILHNNLQKINSPRTIIRQPQGDRRSSQEQLEKYKICQRICAKFS
jgi:hypothetical protein